MKIGLEKADREGSSCFLSGSPMGVPVYGKLGFEDVGRLELSLEEFGGEGSHVHGEFLQTTKSENWGRDADIYNSSNDS